MLRIACLPGLASARLTLTPRLLAIGLGVAVTGCSANISRFDAPMFGLTESGNRVASAPIPRASVLSNGTPSTSYGGSYDSAPISVASLPNNRNRSDYDSYSGASQAGYRGGSAQSGDAAPSYQTAYPRPPQGTYQRTPAYEPGREQPTRVAALPPSAPVYRPLSSQPHAAATAPSQRANHPAPRAAAGDSREVEVQPGDTLYSLAQRNGASISELMTLNGLRNPSVHPGQKIMLPERPTAVAAAVRRGPASKSENTRVAALSDPAEAPEPNRDRQAAVVNELSSGASPAAPAGASQQTETAAQAGETYTMKSGDSLYGIAVRHRVPLAELQRINGITDPRKIRAGTVLKLPSSSARPTAVASVQDRQPQVAFPSDTKPTAPLQTAAASAEPTAAPVIINASATTADTQVQRVAALDRTGTATDAAPTPLTLQSGTSSGVSESGRASDPHGAGETKSDAAGKFRWPVRGKVIAGFGKQPDGSHSDGIRLAVPLGTEVHAAESGVVAYAGNELKGYGNLVLLRHDNGWITAYAHNDELSVKRGDRVRRGQVIAKAGNTGNIDKPQLHFELRQGSSPVNPIPHLEKL